MDLGERRGRGSRRKGRKESCGHGVLYEGRTQKKKKKTVVCKLCGWDRQQGQSVTMEKPSETGISGCGNRAEHSQRTFFCLFHLKGLGVCPFSPPVKCCISCEMDTASIYLGLKPPRTLGAWHESPPSLPPGQSLYFSL